MIPLGRRHELHHVAGLEVAAQLLAAAVASGGIVSGGLLMLGLVGGAAADRPAARPDAGDETAEAIDA
ncbi:MAG: hypothetical protein HY726_13985, partial [Candidatus Rokubacteria bacterium]|nr:hypothetical protein [Candidatus Rokubacteria bacterium]